MSHQDASVMCALSTQRFALTTGQAVHRADAQRKTRCFAVHMKLFSTGLVPRTWCGSLPLLEPREFIVTSSTGFPRCSVSSRQSHELRTCSPLTELGVCGHRSQTHVLQFVFSSNAQIFFGELQGLSAAAHVTLHTKIAEHKRCGQNQLTVSSLTCASQRTGRTNQNTKHKIVEK